MEEPLWNAIWKKDFDQVKRLIEKHDDFNAQAKNGYTILMQASEAENKEIFDLILSKGADINGKGYNGSTPIHIAVDISIDGIIQNVGEQGDEPMDFILHLLSKGADPSIKDNDGKSALDWAKSYNAQKIMAALANVK